MKNCRIQTFEKSLHVLQNIILYLLRLIRRLLLIHRFAGLQLTSLLALNSQGDRLINRWLVLLQNYSSQLLGSQITTRHLTLWLLFYRTFSLLLLLDAPQMILSDINLGQMYRGLMHTKNQDIIHVCSQDFRSNPKKKTRSNVVNLVVVLSFCIPNLFPTMFYNTSGRFFKHFKALVSNIFKRLILALQNVKIRLAPNQQ